VKFTPAHGEVTVEVAAREGNAELRVRDTGVGIRAEELELIFEPFAQVAQGLARTQGGSGSVSPSRRGSPSYTVGGSARGATAPGAGPSSVWCSRWRPYLLRSHLSTSTVEELNALLAGKA
jgi:hypothetical protein